MAKDKANIFKLDDNEQKKYDKDPFFDCRPGALEYAQGFLGNILNRETPYVLLLEDNFGMGKTHFLTRFTKFLMQNNIDTIYFSAWENDYLSDPFLSFSKEVLKYFNNVSLKKKAKEVFVSTTKSMGKLILNLAKSTNVSAGFKPLGVGVEMGVDNEKVIKAIEDLFDDFKQKKDSIQLFKEELKIFIENLDNKKLVLIVDELDRCRPDYAMKTLEVVKHFFDIEGLFIIVPSNESSLNHCVEALYGINQNKDNDVEWYLSKFFDGREPLYKPDYKKIVEDFNFQIKLKDVIDSQKLLGSGNRYNSLNTLKEKLAYYAEKMQLTIREMTITCRKIEYYCKHINKKLDCEYLAYIICDKVRSNKSIKCELNNQHPFNDNGVKKNMLIFSLPKEVFVRKGYSGSTYDSFTAFYSIFREHNFTSYSALKGHISMIKEHFKQNDFNTIKNNNSGYVISYNLDEILAQIEERIDELIIPVIKYQKEWDSDDKDSIIKKYYDEIVDEPQKLHILN